MMKSFLFSFSTTLTACVLASAGASAASTTQPDRLTQGEELIAACKSSDAHVLDKFTIHADPKNLSVPLVAAPAKMHGGSEAGTAGMYFLQKTPMGQLLFYGSETSQHQLGGSCLVSSFGWTEGQKLKVSQTVTCAANAFVPHALPTLECDLNEKVLSQPGTATAEPDLGTLPGSRGGSTAPEVDHRALEGTTDQLRSTMPDTSF